MAGSGVAPTCQSLSSSCHVAQLCVHQDKAKACVAGVYNTSWLLTMLLLTCLRHATIVVKVDTDSNAVSDGAADPDVLKPMEAGLAHEVQDSSVNVQAANGRHVGTTWEVIEILQHHGQGSHRPQKIAMNPQPILRDEHMYPSHQVSLYSLVEVTPQGVLPLGA